MVEETMMDPNAPVEWAPMQEWAPTEEGGQEEQIISQVIQLIAGLSADAQRQLMWFLNEQFTEVVSEEQEEIKQSPEEQQRKADVMSEAF